MTIAFGKYSLGRWRKMRSVKYFPLQYGTHKNTRNNQIGVIFLMNKKLVVVDHATKNVQLIFYKNLYTLPLASTKLLAKLLSNCSQFACSIKMCLRINLSNHASLRCWIIQYLNFLCPHSRIYSPPPFIISDSSFQMLDRCQFLIELIPNKVVNNKSVQ